MILKTSRIKIHLYHIFPIIIILLPFSFVQACSDYDPIEVITEQVLRDEDKAALIFMLEEEKLARDTYIFLNNVRSINQFANIKDSEQTHGNAIQNLLAK